MSAPQQATPPAQSVSPAAQFDQPTQCRRYEGRVAIVTGAAQGLGRVIARRLAEEGAAGLVLVDIQSERVVDTAAQLESQTGRPMLGIGGDLSQPGVAEQVVAQTLTRFGRIDTLVNNAAALIRLRLVDFTEALMQQAVQGNVWTTLRCCKAVLPTMLAQRYGRIVNIGGEAWRNGAPFHTLLAGVGKGSMVGLTVTLAGETVRDGITVNCVSPGAIDTSLDGGAPSNWQRDPAWTGPGVMDELGRLAGPRSNFISRPAHPSEVAGAVAYFGSPEASYVTGQHIGVSGGMAMI
ncbi:MAG: SDR family oxidoreductase [Burkholderiales bacterium]|nr:SDR family oxidoreductase [Burkholderiales bacterium]